MGEPQHLFQTFLRDTMADLHHQHYLRIQPPTAKCSPCQIRIPNGRHPTENAVSGHDGYCQKGNRTPAGLEHDPYAKGYLLCGKYAYLTLMSKDI